MRQELLSECQVVWKLNRNFLCTHLNGVVRQHVRYIPEMEKSMRFIVVLLYSNIGLVVFW